MVLSEDELWEARKEEAHSGNDPVIGIGYRDNPTFDTIIAVCKSGRTYVWKTCAWDDDPEQLAKEYAEKVKVPYLGIVRPSMTRLRYG